MSFREVVSRLRVCRDVLRGWSVIHGVSVSDGTVKLHRQNLALSGRSDLYGNRILVSRPVRVTGSGLFLRNTGDALTPQALARQDQDEAPPAERDRP